MILRLFLARRTLLLADNNLQAAKIRVLKDNDKLTKDLLKVQTAQAHYDRAYEIWWDIGVSKKGA